VSVTNGAGIPANHAHHDRLLVSRHAADDSYPGEVEQARALIAQCADCAALATDIRALSAATSRLGAPARPRDFRITAEQAERLRGSAFERFLRRLAGPGLAPARPLAGVALSIGLMLVVAGAAMPAGGDAAVFGDVAADHVQQLQTPEASPAMANAPGAPEAPPDQVNRELGGIKGQAAGGEANSRLRAQDSAQAAAAEMREPLIYAGLALALASLGVLLLILLARRRANDPLLR
jgi:hypothetical protein